MKLPGSFRLRFILDFCYIVANLECDYWCFSTFALY
ncbi:hypothetical protein FSU_1779 [Fibrobacter succinogenes subsp. succinogenes S85]|uniref:Uncharacterized protein n=1 Tax=Fibrobacter succinogenes (strain ATCC 19169 / S85) TaxID=59374 RepID=D9SB38_FIBSS|nr:hypothetical protein FSU_1779 [Fibrobacter succinogenes subsp. succinogenes S85]